MDKTYCDYLDWVENKYKERQELEQIYNAIINYSDLSTFNKYFIPLSVIDDIRAEIEEHAKINQNLNTDRARALCWCLDVIDKYKAESEDTNATG